MKEWKARCSTGMVGPAPACRVPCRAAEHVVPGHRKDPEVKKEFAELGFFTTAARPRALFDTLRLRPRAGKGPRTNQHQVRGFGRGRRVREDCHPEAEGEGPVLWALKSLAAIG